MSALWSLRAVLFFGMLGLGCAAPTQRTCELSPPERVVANDALGFDGIALTRLPTPSAPESATGLYVWSDATGLWVQRALANSLPVRVADRCRGGVAATSFERQAFIACSRPLDDPEQPETSVLLYRLTAELEPSLLSSFGRVGRDGRGVAIGADADSVQVAFHDGSIGEHTITLATWSDGALTTKLLSHEGQTASEPALLLREGHVYVVFSELELTTNGKPASTVWLSRDGERASLLVRSGAFSPTPKLSSDARSLVLSYRDRSRWDRKGGRRGELYVVRLNSELKLSGRPRDVGRANTEGEPSVFGCGSLTTALLPREYGGERFVGINALDGELSSVGAGHQLYATGREFVLASGTCLGTSASGEDSWLLFAADRAAPGKPGSEAVSMRFSCKQ